LEPQGHAGAQVVNEPSAWSMSQLVTPDPEGAKTFYGEVFGWTTDAFAAGDLEVTLFRLAGFVGGVPEQPVPRDLVAVAAPAPDGVPPHWAVDFWINDAEGAAATAEALGGRLLDAVSEAAGFRRAALADPQGAMFTVSQLMAAH
jgi:predicted enzyme related to lactoylglutathione lyase